MPKIREKGNLPAGVSLPEKFTALRPHQERAVTEIMDAYERGARVVFLDAPVGTGKTVISEVVRQLLGTDALFMCSTTSLQEQFVADFPYSRVLKGRRNYTPTDPRGLDVTCEDCDRDKVGEDEYECTHCVDTDQCPYRVAKTDAEFSRLAVINTAYFLAETQNEQASVFTGRGLGIIDEADLLEGALMRHIEFVVSKRVAKFLGVTPPKKQSHKPTIQTWIDEVLIPELKRGIKKLGGGDLTTQRMKRQLVRLLARAKTMDLVDNDYWVRDNKSFHPLHLKPYRVHLFGNAHVWDKAGQWLCMSGSIYPDVDAPALGLDEDEWETVRVPMTFPPENRPIVYSSVGKMTRAEREKTLPKMAKTITALAAKHPDENILVHTVSYQVAADLERLVSSDTHQIHTYTQASERDRVISLFDSERVLVLAPSLDRGIDLVGDRCRVQIIACIPYPYLGDPLINARMHDEGGELWYRTETARSLVQMAGRAVRNPTDTATTYILDGSYSSFLARGGDSLLPEWWHDVLTCVPASRLTS